jgi:ATP-dependent DNA ligase
VERKVDFIASMFKMASTDDELRYLVRSFANTGLRIGLSTKTVESTVHEKFEYDEQALSLFEREIFGYRLRNLTNLPSKAMYHVPIKPMTGKPAKDAADLLKSLSKKVDRAKLVADYKYDGERTQIHWD